MPDDPDAQSGVREVPLDHVVVDPSQPPRDWDSLAARQALADLVASIRAFGLLQPLLVRPHPATPAEGPRYLLIAGRRRREAARRAGLATVPVALRAAPGVPVVRAAWLRETLRRHALSPLDEARAYAELMDLEDLSAEDLARRLHVAAQAIRTRLRMLTNQVVADGLARGQLSLTAGYLLLTLPAETQQPFLARLRGGERLLIDEVLQARQTGRKTGAALLRSVGKDDLP